MIDILMPLTKTVYIELEEGSRINFAVFTGVGLEYNILKTAEIPSTKILKGAFVDLTSIIYLIKMRRQIDVLFNFQSESILLTFMAKLLRKKVIHFMGGSLSKSVKAIIQLPNVTFIYKMLWLMYEGVSNLAFRLSDKLVLISPLVVEADFRKKYSKKIAIAYNFPSSHFYRDFHVDKPFSQRPLQIGYVGELSPKKGVWLFAKAIPKIISVMPDLKIVFIGDIESDKPDNIGKCLQKEFDHCANVLFVGHVPNEALPKYLNNFRLLVLPSFSEGIPAVILEAMACGTPVAATPVGAIPQIIKDQENGYILRSNSSDYLAENILKVLSDNETIARVSECARVSVQKDFNYEKTVAMWRRILQDIAYQKSTKV
jgi:glycosyltransferase involved in cell wall biosynthesis